MGLFSGGFFGSGSNESKKYNTTTTNTTTTTNVHDIGLTGAAAVDLANVISGNVGTTLSNLAVTLENVLLGAEVESTKRIETTVELTKVTNQLLTQAAQDQSQLLLSQAKDVSTPVLTVLEGFQKNLLYAAVIVVVIMLFKGRRG
jgi:hypothetical protein